MFFLCICFTSCLIVLGLESSRAIESQLADFLVFLRRVLSLRVMRRISTFVKWVDPIMAIVIPKCPSGKNAYKQILEVVHMVFFLFVFLTNSALFQALLVSRTFEQSSWHFIF